VVASACGRLDFDRAKDASTPDVSASCTRTALDMSTLRSDGGFAWMISDGVGRWGLADVSSTMNQSTLRLFEDARELGPAHALHVNIRDLGLGRFSHWTESGYTQDSIRFAPSDNSDPNSNGRTYAYCP